MKARPWPLRSAQTVALAAALGLAPLTAVQAAAAPAVQTPTGTVFDLGTVIAELKRQIAAADAGPAGLRIDDAQLDLGLVEPPGGRGGLVVPGADYAAPAGTATARPSLKRRIVVELEPAAGPAIGGGGGAGVRLAEAIGELRAGVQQAVAADPAFDLKKFTIDLDFALGRDGKGAPQLILFARDRRIDSANIHGLKLRLAAAPKEKDPRGKEANVK
ncbi:MAG: hypothetical protein U1E66_07060 [Rhodospirillales bacterium]